MAESDALFSDREFKNWVKACLAVQVVRDGLMLLVKQYSEDRYSQNIEQVKKLCNVQLYSCSQCDIAELAPFHKSQTGTCAYRTCSCHKRNIKPCPANESCGVIYDQIMSAHEDNDPKWTNTNCGLWWESHWEQMKCYIFTSGYKNKKNISEADITALLQICLNYEQLKKAFGCDVEYLKKVQSCRNEMFHSSEMRLSNDQLKDHVSHMKTFLRLGIFKDFHSAIVTLLEKLDKLDSGDNNITNEDALVIIHEVTKSVCESLAEIKKQYTCEIDQLNEARSKQEQKFEELKSMIDCNDLRLKQLFTQLDENEKKTNATLTYFGKTLISVDRNTKNTTETLEMVKASQAHTTETLEMVKASQAHTTETLEMVMASQAHTTETLEMVKAQATNESNEMKIILLELIREVKDIEKKPNVNIATKIIISTVDEEDDKAMTEALLPSINGVVKNNYVEANMELKDECEYPIQMLQKGGNVIECIEQLCIEILITSPTVESWVSLCEDFITGTIAEGFVLVQRQLRTHQGLENMTLKLTLDEEYFLHGVRLVMIKGRQVIESATMEGHDAVTSATEAGVTEVKATVIKGQRVIESATMEGRDAVMSATEASVTGIKATVIKGQQVVESATIKGHDAVSSATEAGVTEVKATVIKGQWAIESATMGGCDTVTSATEAGVTEVKATVIKGQQVIESATMEGHEAVISATEAGVTEVKTTVIKGEWVIESATMQGHDAVTSATEAGVTEVKATVIKGQRVVELATMEGHDAVSSATEAGVTEVKTTVIKGQQVIESAKIEEIKTWLIEQYQSKCVAPVSILDPDIDVPLERIYVPPSIQELKRGQKDRCGGIETDNTSRGETDVSCYKELLHRDGNQINTIYIQGDPGCGKTTFSTKLVLDWCTAHSENIISTKTNIPTMTTSSKETWKETHFSDLDALRDYAFLFFVSLRDYSGSMCNVSQMVEDAIKSNKLPWDDSVWEHKCIVLTDAADEWYHPDLSFPPPCDNACRCSRDRSMPQYLKRKNITNIITARPWKLANLRMDDSLTRMFQISGVANYQTLAKNVINVLAEKDGISQKAQQSKCNDFLEKLKNPNMGNLMTIPAICVQLVHQFYVGRLMEGSLCAIYINMLDMHIAKGLLKRQIEDFDTEEIRIKEIAHIFETGKNEYMSANGSLVRSASALAFKTLTDSSKESSLVFAENTITNHMPKTQLDYLLQTGIITKKKSLALSSRKSIPYMFVHKTIQEFLASMHIAINQTDIEDIMSAIHSAYCDGKSILDIGQLFIFTCGMCAPAAERMSKHIMDVITRDMESKLLSISDPETDLFSTPYFAQTIVMDGFIERLANKQPCLQLTLTHIALKDYRSRTIKEIDALHTLIDMNISNITSMDARFTHKSQQEALNLVQEIISQSRESLSYLQLLYTGQLDLQGLKLKCLSCTGNSVLSNLDCTYMRSCFLIHPTPLSQRRILQSMSFTGKNITHLQLKYFQSIDLLRAALPDLTSLHTLTIYETNHAVTLLYHLPESIRKVVYRRSDVSAQDVKSMVKWSKSRDACVCCVLLDCRIAANETDTCNWMKQQDGIDITQLSVHADGILKDRYKISISWSTILSK